MNSYRITKYSPQFRNAEGNYLLEEWTSFYDIGNEFEGKYLQAKDYEDVENKYIQAIKLVVEVTNVNTIKIQDLETTPNKRDREIEEGEIISKEELPNILKMILREQIWCKLIGDNQLEVHFGYEYYMYIVGSVITKSVVECLEQIEGLCIEKFDSPYLEYND